MIFKWFVTWDVAVEKIVGKGDREKRGGGEWGGREGVATAQPKQLE